MATIAFIPYLEAGHFRATFGLARALMRSGHRVLYFAIPDFTSLVTKAGFEAVTIFPDVYPSGVIERFQTNFSAEAIADFTERYEQACERTIKGELDEVMMKSGADVFVVDVCHPVFSLNAHKLGKKVFLVSGTFPMSIDYSRPPLVTTMKPATSFASKAKQIRAWNGIALKNVYAHVFRRGLRVFRFVVRMARVAKFPITHINFLRLQFPKPAFPELVMWPDMMELPGKRSPDMIYATPSIDEEPLDNEPPRPAGAPPLVYCAFGTQTYRHPELKTFCVNLINVMRNRSEDLVLAVGNAPFECPPLPPNVTLLKVAPQRALLKRASVFITHAGPASIKESIWAGVPMIVVPLKYDQPGNAVRVVEKGIGIMANAKTTSESDITDALDRLRDSRYKERCEDLRRAFKDAERAETGVVAIERVLSGAPLV